MTIILFLVDTSASMLQRVHSQNGKISLIDLTKIAIETFISNRQHKTECSGDRYMLLTFEEFPNNIKAGWKENLGTFMNELKNLQCNCRTVMGTGLRQAYDLLNLNRMQSGIDTYSHGRNPFFVESALIILITDGGHLSTPYGITYDLSIPIASQIPGSELTLEPFRWDQRLYSIVLRMPGAWNGKTSHELSLIPSDDSPVDKLCEVTGGRSYCITTYQMLFQCIESLVHKVTDGVVVQFEMISPEDEKKLTGFDEDFSDDLDSGDQPSEHSFALRAWEERGSMKSILDGTKMWQTARNLIYISKSSGKKHGGYWPIPESYWPDITNAELPPRSAQPKLVYRCGFIEPVVPKNIPCDKYKLAPSLLTQHILGQKDKNICWFVYVLNSGKQPDCCHPFGYLKVNSKINSVHLIILPYNFPVFIPLIEELAKVLKYKPHHDWLRKFHGYLGTVPMYYHNLLKNAMIMVGFPNSLLIQIMPQFMISQLNYTVQNYLQAVRQRAKTEHEILCEHVIYRQTLLRKQTANGSNNQIIPVGIKSFPKYDPQASPNSIQIPSALTKNPNFGSSFIHRNDLVTQIRLLRQSFLRRDNLIHVGKHSLPISEMGNYIDYMKKLPPPLRELEPSGHDRKNFFGNPFKHSSSTEALSVEEAYVNLNTTIETPNVVETAVRTRLQCKSRSEGVLNEARKRKHGPLPKTYSFDNLKRLLNGGESSGGKKLRMSKSEGTVCNGF